MQHVDLKEIRSGALLGKKVTVCGWVRTSRDSKNVAYTPIISTEERQRVFARRRNPSAAA